VALRLAVESGGKPETADPGCLFHFGYDAQDRWPFGFCSIDVGVLRGSRPLLEGRFFCMCVLPVGGWFSSCYVFNSCLLVWLAFGSGGTICFIVVAESCFQSRTA
jgi:hypothetical protein